MRIIVFGFIFNFFLISISSSVTAQERLNSIGLNAGMEFFIGDPGQLYKLAFGPNIEYQRFVRPRQALGFSAGFYNHTLRSEDEFQYNGARLNYSKLAVIPITISYSFFFSEAGPKPYLGFEFGYHYYRYNFDVIDRFGNGPTEVTVTNGKGAIAFKPGFRYQFGESGFNLGAECKFDILITATGSGSGVTDVMSGNEAGILFDINPKLGAFYTF